jgi:hypothetical protein
LNVGDFRRIRPPKEETGSRRECRDANRFSSRLAEREKPIRFPRKAVRNANRDPDVGL